MAFSCGALGRDWTHADPRAPRDLSPQPWGDSRCSPWLSGAGQVTLLGLGVLLHNVGSLQEEETSAGKALARAWHLPQLGSCSPSQGTWAPPEGLNLSSLQSTWEGHSC